MLVQEIYKNTESLKIKDKYYERFIEVINRKNKN